MTSRKWIILGAMLLALTVGAELVFRPGNSSKGRVQIVNQGDATMDDLVVRCGKTELGVGQLGAGQSTNLWFTPAGKGTLSLEFNQKGNPMMGFQVQDFDPGEDARNGFKLVLVVKNDRIERFMEDDETTTPLKSLKDRVSAWFDSELAPQR